MVKIVQKGYGISFLRYKRPFCLLLIDFLQTSKTITGEYYCNLLDQIDEKIRKKRPGLLKKKISFIKTMHRLPKFFYNGQIKGVTLRIVWTSTLFTKFGSLDFHLFRNLKKFLCGVLFSSIEAVRREVFWRSSERSLQGWDNALEKIYWV